MNQSHKPLTKDQRYTAYCILFNEIPSSSYIGFCGLVDYLFDIDLDEDRRFTNFKKYFPELWEKRDKGKDEYSEWLWCSTAARLAALKKCITETENF